MNQVMYLADDMTEQELLDARRESRALALRARVERLELDTSVLARFGRFMDRWIGPYMGPAERKSTS